MRKGKRKKRETEESKTGGRKERRIRKREKEYGRKEKVGK